MGSSFGRELLTREVVDSHGEKLGTLSDVSIDHTSGAILDVLVDVSKDIDVSKLPWTVFDGLVRIPISEVDRIATRIHLKR